MSVAPSLALDVGRLDDWPPLLDLGLVQRAEGLRGLLIARENLLTEIGELRARRQLLDRNPQGVEPTRYGRALLECGAAVFDDLHQGVKNIEFLADPRAGEVRIGSSAFLAATFVSSVVDRLSRRYPRIVFHLLATESDALGHELSERNVDLVIASVRGGLVADEKFSFDVLYDDSIVVVAGAQSPWFGGGASRLPI